MRRARGLSFLLALTSGIVALETACSVLLGFERPDLETDGGAVGDEHLGETGRPGDGPVTSPTCEPSTPCAGGLACLFGRCAASCQQDGECKSGERCLVTTSGRGCVGETTRCESGTCPAGTRCTEDGRCRTTCTAADAPGASCALDQACVFDVCHGRSAEHDPGALVRPNESWLVSVPLGPTFATYVTDRDCRNPARICTGCAGLSFSPSGKTALLALGTRETFGWMLSYLRLDAERPLPATPTAERTLPSGCDGVMLDDDLVAYRRSGTSCDTATSIGRWSTVTNENGTIATGFGRGIGDLLARPSKDGGLALPIAAASTVDGGVELRIMTIDGGLVASRVLPADAGEYLAPFGASADGSELLAQVGLSTGSRIDRIEWSSGATMSSPYSDLPPSVAARFGCARTRHLPSTGEFLCLGGGDAGAPSLYRLGIDGRAPTPITCTIDGQAGVVADVHAP